MEDPLGLPGNDPGLRGERALPIPVIQLLQVLTVALGAPGVTDVIARVEARLLARRFFRWEQRSGASSEPGDVVAARSAPGSLF